MKIGFIFVLRLIFPAIV